MKTKSLLYIHNKGNILLVNWRKYGFWCCVGGTLGEHGNTLYEAGVNSAKCLCGISPEITNLRGIFMFNDKVKPDDSSISYVFDAVVKKSSIIINAQLNNAKWVPVNKVLNYKLFPNSERYLLNTYLNSDTFFNLTLEYTNSGINKSVEYWR